MNMTITISDRWQTVIPAAIRRRYGIKPRSKIEIIDTGKEIILVPLPSDPFKASRGSLTGLRVSDLLQERRAERRRENA